MVKLQLQSNRIQTAHENSETFSQTPYVHLKKQQFEGDLGCQNHKVFEGFINGYRL